MKIGLIVDGQAEPVALRNILEKIQIQSVHTILTTAFYAGMQPRASAKQIARAAAGKVQILQAKSVDLIVVLMDLEDAPCPSHMATDIKKAFIGMYDIPTEVVIKRRKLENWLIADPIGLEALTARFSITQAFVKKVSPNRADDVVDAEELLNSVINKKNYHKRTDPPSITERQCPDTLGRNSRSFRRFLRVLGYKSYIDQSKVPLP